MLRHNLGTTTVKFFGAAIIACVFAVTGCKSTPPAPAPAPVQSQAPVEDASNPTLNSDGTTSTSDRTPAQAPASQSPVADAAPVQRVLPPPPPPPPFVLPVGSRVAIRTTEALSASHNEVGDKFSGELSRPIVSHGATVFPRGTRVAGTVVAAKGRGRFKGSGALAIEVNTIGGLHVETSEYEQELQGKGKRTGGLIGGGAGLGAIIGGLAGGGKGALIGGLAGAGAGTAGAAYTGNKDVVIPSESLVTFRLAAPLTVQRTAAQ